MVGQAIGGVLGADCAKIDEPLRSEFERLVHQRTGMAFGFRRVSELEQTICTAALSSGATSLDEYHRVLASSPTDSLPWDDLVERLTIGETYFFRNAAHFDALRWQILPPILRKRQSDKRLRIWSAGCSTGEEPFSLAILLREMIPGIEDWRITILGTDINKESLQKARRGLFRPWSLRKLSDAQKGAYFRPHGEEFELLPRIREMVTFSCLNLAEDTYPALTTNTTALDLILCRNVTIYFSLEAIQQTAERFHSCLLNDGWLITGAAETNSEIYARFAVRSLPGAVLYQKPKGEANVQNAAPPPRVSGRTVQSSVLSVEMEDGSASSPVPSNPSKEVADQSHLDAYREARGFIERGDEWAAVASLKKAVSLCPEFTQAHYLLTRLHANGGRLADARECCESMLEIDPLCAEGHFTLGLIAQEEGKTDEATSAFQRTLQLSPAFILAHHGLSVSLARAGDVSQAEAHRKAAMSLVQELDDHEVLPGSENLQAGQLRNMLRGTQ